MADNTGIVKYTARFPSPLGVKGISTLILLPTMPVRRATRFRPLSGLKGFQLKNYKVIFGSSIPKRFPSPLGVKGISTRTTATLTSSARLLFPSPLGVKGISTYGEDVLECKHDGRFPSPLGVKGIST